MLEQSERPEGPYIVEFQRTTVEHDVAGERWRRRVIRRQGAGQVDIREALDACAPICCAIEYKDLREVIQVAIGGSPEQQSMLIQRVKKQVTEYKGYLEDQDG